MNIWGEWNFSPETEDRLKEIFLSIYAKNQAQPFNVWLQLMNHGVTEMERMELEIIKGDTEEDVAYLLSESLENGTALPEASLLRVSNNSLNTILQSIRNSLNEIKFSNFCKMVGSWSDDNLIDHSLELIVLPKLKGMNESSAFTTFALKELALSKPDKLCQTVLIPLLTKEEFHFSDAELLSEVFSVLGNTKKDLLIMSLAHKEFQEKDWLLLHPLIKGLSQNSLLVLSKSIQKFSNKFKKSHIFGRFLVSFCKNVEFIENKDLLLAAVKEHQTLLKNQAQKYLESV